MIRPLNYILLPIIAGLCLSSAEESLGTTCCGSDVLPSGETCCNTSQPLHFFESDTAKCCNDYYRYDPSLREGSFSIQLTATDNLKLKVRNVLQKIPGLGGIEVKDANLSVTKTTGDCCPGGSNLPSSAPVTDGVQGVQGSVNFSISAKDLPVWPVPPLTQISKEETIAGILYKLDVAVGAFLTLNVGTSPTIGFVKNDCPPKKICHFGSINLSIDAALELKFQALVCAKVGWIPEVCGEVDIVPVAASLSCSK